MIMDKARKYYLEKRFDNLVEELELLEFNSECNCCTRNAKRKVKYFEEIKETAKELEEYYNSCPRLKKRY